MTSTVTPWSASRQNSEPLDLVYINPFQDFRRIMLLSILRDRCYWSYPLVTASFLPMRSVGSSAVSVCRMVYVETPLRTRLSLTTGWGGKPVNWRYTQILHVQPGSVLWLMATTFTATVTQLVRSKMLGNCRTLFGKCEQAMNWAAALNCYVDNAVPLQYQITAHRLWMHDIKLKWGL